MSREGALARVSPRPHSVPDAYAVAPLNVIPRMAGASPAITFAATAVAGIVAVTGCAVAAIAAIRTANTA